MEIGKKIQQQRRKLNMTQEQLAEKVFVTPQAVSLWENEKSTPDIYKIGLIAKALHMDRAELISDEEKNKPSWVLRDQFFSEKNMRRKLKEFAQNEGLMEMNASLDFAWVAHDGQYRKTSVYSDEQVPYIVHPLIMACHAHAIGIRDDAVLAAALLHDVCEDCGVEPEKLPVSRQVKHAVSLLTKKDGMNTEEYYGRIADDPTAAIVKALDRCNNLSTMMLGFSREKILEYVDETQEYVLPLLDHIKKRIQPVL